MTWLRDYFDAWALTYAAHVFKRNGFKDAPGRLPVVDITVTHLTYQGRAARLELYRKMPWLRG